MPASHDTPPPLPIRDRLAWAGRFRGLVASHEADFAQLVEQELGKPRWETLTADIAPLLASLRWHGRHARRLLTPRTLRGGGLLAMGQRHVVRREPLGCVAIIATWNYPVGLLGVQLTQAVIAGNAVTVKPSEHAPRTQSLLLELARRAGLDGDRLTVTEPTREAGRSLLAGHAFDHVIFTGSTEVGRSIAEILAPTLTPSTLELSGRDSALVLEDAATRVAAQSIWYAATANAGQTCMAPRRVLVHRRVYDAFLRDLGLLAGAAGPRRLINEQAAAHAFGLARSAKQAGARSISGVFEANQGATLRPLAMVDCPPDAELVEGRHFGPVFAVVPCSSEAEMIEIHRRCDQHLATSVFTRRPRAARRRLAGHLRVATVTFNDCLIPTAHPAASIGGVDASGWGRSQGEAGLLELTRPVTTSRTSLLLRPPLEPPPPGRMRQMAGWFTRLHGARRGLRITLAKETEPSTPASRGDRSKVQPRELEEAQSP